MSWIFCTIFSVRNKIFCKILLLLLLLLLLLKESLERERERERERESIVLVISLTIVKLFQYTSYRIIFAKKLFLLETEM